MATTAVENIIQQTPLFRMQRASICPIYCLPIEILEIIFVICARDYHGSASGEPILTAPCWVNVSYVSRHWRNAALNCPSLWTYLFITSPRWTAELLARSKKASLKLNVQVVPKRRTLYFLDKVLNHVERIQELRLDLPFGESAIDSRYLSKLFSCRAPRLQNLQISTNNFISHWTREPFGGNTPALRTLDLAYCPVPWYSFKLGGLTMLNLRGVPQTVRLRQNTMEFLATLGRMQDLMHLYLVDALPSAAGFLSSTAFDTFQKINLPHLSRLHVAAPLSTVIALLSCVNIPLETELRLDCGVEGSSPHHDYALLYSLLAQRLGKPEDQALSSLTIHTLVISFLDFGWATLAFSTLEGDCDFLISASCLEWDCDIPLQIILPPGVLASDISDICCSIPLTNVQSVHVVNPPFSSRFWREILEHLEDLRYLKLSDGCMPDLASMLSVTHCGLTTNQEQHDNGGVVPGLEELELCDITFLPVLDDDADSPKAADVQSLCDALSTRKEPRGRVTMTRCIKSNSRRKWREFDMTGWWEGGRFHVIEERRRRYSKVEDTVLD
ncbi:hypothetical protein EV363DRAFT_1315243 [Boletus edulis]|nr:hypothetical protein EV363DRAFT_1315243 [Boletus edulis]